MDMCELIERDLRKARVNLVNASKRPNVTEKELEHLKELVALREQIFSVVAIKGGI